VAEDSTPRERARPIGATPESSARPLVFVTMSEANETMVVVVRPGRSARRSSQVLRWLRCLLPAAYFVVTDARFGSAANVITIDADVVDSPLAVAHALLRDNLAR
jgi:hypothetical protein